MRVVRRSRQTTARIAAAVVSLLTACGGAARHEQATNGAPTTGSPAPIASAAAAPAPAATTSSTTGAPPASIAAEIASSAQHLPAASSALTSDDGRSAPAPARLAIPALGVDAAAVIPVGVDDTGALEVPEPMSVGWYRFGAAPGDIDGGSVVIAGHVDFNRVPGAFRHLADLQAGDEVFVTTGDGVVHEYTVDERAMYDKESLPERVWARTGEPALVLVTCGGKFDAKRRSFEQNVVVFARPSGGGAIPPARSVISNGAVDLDEGGRVRDARGRVWPPRE